MSNVFLSLAFCPGSLGTLTTASAAAISCLVISLKQIIFWQLKIYQFLKCISLSSVLFLMNIILVRFWPQNKLATEKMSQTRLPQVNNIVRNLIWRPSPNFSRPGFSGSFFPWLSNDNFLLFKMISFCKNDVILLSIFILN